MCENVNWAKIKKNFEKLEDELNVKPLLGYLYQEDVLSDDEKERIDIEPTTKDKARKFLGIIRYKSDAQLEKFLRKLSSEQHYLAELIEGTEIEFKSVKGLITLYLYYLKIL